MASWKHMEIRPVQQCRSLDGWIPIEVDSSSTPGVKYVVLVNSWGGPHDAICECKGYEFNGGCKHQLLAFERVCRWHEQDGPEQQSVKQRKDKTCPRCGGATMWVMEAI